MRGFARTKGASAAAATATAKSEPGQIGAGRMTSAINHTRGCFAHLAATFRGHLSPDRLCEPGSNVRDQSRSIESADWRAERKRADLITLRPGMRNERASSGRCLFTAALSQTYQIAPKRRRG